MEKTPENRLLELAQRKYGPWLTGLTAKVQQLQEIQRELRQFLTGPPLTDAQLVENSLLFAKPSPTNDEIAETMVVYDSTRLFRSFAQADKMPRGIRVTLEVTKPFDRTAPLLPKGWDMQSAWWEANKDARNDFRARLIELKLKPRQALLKIVAEEKALFEEILWIPITPNRNEYVWLTYGALCRLVLNKIAHDMGPDGLWDRLTQCSLPDCSAFFLRKPRKGTRAGQPSKYCSPECREIFHKGERAERQRRSRAKRKGR